VCDVSYIDNMPKLFHMFLCVSPCHYYLLIENASVNASENVNESDVRASDLRANFLSN